MNKEISRYVVVCVSVLCATIWSQGKGVIISDIWNRANEFRTVINGMLK